MRNQARDHGRFVSRSGLRKVPGPPEGRYELIIVDGSGRPLSHLTEWYRRRKHIGAHRTRQTYLDFLLPFMGFQVRKGYLWNATPAHVRVQVLEFLREDVACQVRPDTNREGYLVQLSANSPLSVSGLRVFLAALRDFYQVMREAGYYAYTNPMQSELLTRWKQERMRLIENVGAPDSSGIRGETWQETRQHPTAFFRQGEGTGWSPKLAMESDEVRQRLHDALFFMIQHAASQRDKVVLQLLLLTGARLHEVLGLTVGGYRQAHHLTRAMVVNKGSFGREEKTIYFTDALAQALIKYIRVERSRYDPQGRKRLEDLTDRDPIFLTERGTSYTSDDFRYHWRKLYIRAQARYHVTFTPHDIRHLFVTENMKRIKAQAAGDAAKLHALKEGFQAYMAWRSRETMRAYDHSFSQSASIQAIATWQAEIEQGLQGSRKTQKQRPAEEPMGDSLGTSRMGLEEKTLGDDNEEDLQFWEEDL